MRNLKKFLKNNLKIILAIVITAIVTGSVTAFATYNYFSKDIEYKKDDGTKISVEDSLNELYLSKNKRPAYIKEINNIKVDGDYFEIIPDILTGNSDNSYITLSASSELREQSIYGF